MAEPIRRAFTMETFAEENRVNSYSMIKTIHNLTRALSTTLGAFMMEHWLTPSPFLLAAQDADDRG